MFGDLDEQIQTLETALAKRRDVKQTRLKLQLLLQLSALLQKCERLLREYSAMKTADDNALVLMERLAGETAQLNFILSRVTHGALVQNFSVRLEAVKRGVRNNLDSWLGRCLLADNSYDMNILPRVLTMYVVTSFSAEAETFFRRQIVAPFTSSKLRMASLLSEAERRVGNNKSASAADALAVAEEYIVEFLGDKVMPLVSLCDSEERLAKLDFVTNAVWPQIERAISTNMAAVFSPGIPDIFHRAIRSGTNIYNAMLAAVSSDDRKEKLISSATTQAFWKHWNIPVYFQLRFQEIASRFDEDIGKGPIAITGKEQDEWKSTISLLRCDIYKAHATASLVCCLRRCWSEDVFLPSLTHRLLRLTLQLIARYATWIRTGLAGEWGTSSADMPATCCKIYEDVITVRERVAAELSSVIRLRCELPDEMLEVADTTFSDAIDTYSTLLPELQTSIVQHLSATCKDNVQPLRGMLATYRMSSKAPPTTHSTFVTKILRPLRSFLLSGGSIPEDARGMIAHGVVDNTAGEYYKMATDLLARNKSSEATLRRLNIGGVARGGGVVEKIGMQLYLDVEKFVDEARSLGVDVDNVSMLTKLRDSVRRDEEEEEEEEEEEKDENVNDEKGDDAVVEEKQTEEKAKADE